MNVAQIKEIFALIQGAAVPSKWSDDLAKQAALNLRPLPYSFALKNARLWAITPNLDAKGHEGPKFLNTLPEVLKAVGVPLGARADLERASRTQGAELMVDLRNTNGLRYVGPTDPIPQGCYEYLRLNQLPVPDRPVAPVDYAAALDGRRALGPGRDGMSRGQVLDLIRRADGRSNLLPVRQSSVTEVRDLLDLLSAHPTLPEVVVEATRRLCWRLEAQIAGLEDQRIVLEERAAELEDAHLGTNPSLGGTLDAIGRLAARISVDHGPAALDVAVGAVLARLLPGLPDVRVKVERTDPLDGRSPLARVLADCRRPTAPPAPERPAPPLAPAVVMPRRMKDLLKVRQ